MNKYCYYDGEIILIDDVKINPYDIGFMRGYGIFDAMRTTKKVLFCLDEHWNKFEKSAQELDLNIPISKSEFKNIVAILLEKNDLKEAAVKTILTGGKSENGFNKSEKSTILILVDDLDKFTLPEESYEKGWKLISLEYQRHLPKIKTLDYLIPIKNQKEKIKNNAQEIVYKKDGNILECSTSNIFIIRNGTIITPKKNIFLGTIRNLVIDIAEKNGFEVLERNVSVEEFLSAEEIFLTATYKKIMPITNVDGTSVNEGKIGKKTKKLMKLLDEFIKNYS
ncbi:MAG: aminotransferase class IV [Parcubacteria group bacterium]|jgi:D-amino acid aminotransferase